MMRFIMKLGIGFGIVGFLLFLGATIWAGSSNMGYLLGVTPNSGFFYGIAALVVALLASFFVGSVVVHFVEKRRQ